jgi:hypothetical protein
MNGNGEDKMSLKRGFSVFCALGLLALNACSGSQTIIVRFDDLKSDFFAMEYQLHEGEWKPGGERTSGAAGDLSVAFHRFGGPDVRI